MYNRDKVINPTTFRIIAGGVKLKDVVGSPIQKRDVENLFLHPEYDHEYLVNDAALLLVRIPRNNDYCIKASKCLMTCCDITVDETSPVPYAICSTDWIGYVDTTSWNHVYCGWLGLFKRGRQFYNIRLIYLMIGFIFMLVIFW